MNILNNGKWLFIVLLGWSLSFESVVAVYAADSSPKQVLQEAQKAYEKRDYQNVLQLLDSLGDTKTDFSQVQRLKMLSFAHLGKTPEGIKEYEKLVKESGREDEELLRKFAMTSILPLRSDMRDQMRGAAYTALKEVKSDEVVPYLEEGLADGSGMVRALVAEALGNLPAGRSSQKFRQALQDQAGWVRAAVIKGLGRTGDQEVVPLIEPLLKDEQPMVQVTAAGALLRLGQRENWARIEQAAVSHDGYERGAAMRILGRSADPRAIPILVNGMSDHQPTIRVASASGLGQLGLSQAVPYLVEALTNGIPALRTAAAVSLGKLGAREAIPLLKKSLHDRDPGVQAAVVDALLRLELPYHVVDPTVRGLLAHKNPGLRSGAAKALANGKIRDVMGPLTLLLNDPVPRPRITAVRSLGRVGGREILPQLKTALRDSDQAVQATAAGAVARILSTPAKT
ncbi:MAG: HEAT repeat domain-containing protein [Nitrospirales bacterium]|nr:HEAT repeat domain-containing protein [Nitrospirales bacterium]